MLTDLMMFRAALAKPMRTEYPTQQTAKAPSQNDSRHAVTEPLQTQVRGGSEN